MNKMKPYLKFVVLILVLFVIVCLSFFIPVFSVPGVLGINCVANTGFYCSDLKYLHVTGNLIVTVGQNTGDSWSAWAIGYAPNGTETLSGIPKIRFSAVPNSSKLYSGQRINITSDILSVSSPKTTIGMYTSGGIWVCFSKANNVTIIGGIGGCTPQGNSSAKVYYVEIATLYAKAS
jgi:hypothetical protein